ncbi:MAG TPA: hypothetical protein VK714_18645 [Myxococcota bacterium]|nr:hypothetical protein [Myxococcota bacterium]
MQGLTQKGLAAARRGLRVAALVAIGLFAPAFARADPGEPGASGPREGFAWHPYASLTAVYDDNVLLAPGGGPGEPGLWFGPGIETSYREGAWRTGADVGADLRQYYGSPQISQYFWRISGFAEVDAMRGLTLRVSDAYAPQPLNYGLPQDDLENLVQSNRLEAQARYRRELPEEFILDLTLRGTRFDSDPYQVRQDPVPAGLPPGTESFNASYDDVTAEVELQRGMGREVIGYARLTTRERWFDDLPQDDLTEVSGLAGIRWRALRNVEVELGGGYGQIDFHSGPTTPGAIGLLQLKGDLEGGWRWNAGVTRMLTSDISGFNYAETVGHAGLEKQLGPRMRATIDAFGGQFDNQAPGVGNQKYYAVEAALRRQLTRTLQAGLVVRHWQTYGQGDLSNVTQNRVLLEFKYRR